MFSITLFGGLAFTLVTLVLYTLAHQLGSAIDRHELIRAARMQQQAYLRNLAERRRGANADYGSDEHPQGDEINVDIVDDGFDVDVLDDEPPARMAA